MGKLSKSEFIEVQRSRYLSAGKVDKGVFLTETAVLFNEHRKSILRRLGRPPKPVARKRGALHLVGAPVAPAKASAGAGRPSHVSESDRIILERLIPLCDFACGKRLVAMLPDWLPHDEKESGAYEKGQMARLLSLSSATLDRHLAPARKRAGIRGRTGTKPGNMLRTQIPIRTDNWDVDRPGYLEADTVAHCGGSMSGQFAWSLTMTDIQSGWTECRAVWNKGSLGVIEQIKDIDSNLPFSLLAVDCDNGSEFLNHHLVAHFTNHPKKPSFTRSRPYHKNDNAHVEQKNWTHVRQLLGYIRIDSQGVVRQMNDLYRTEFSQLMNLFTPNMKLISKSREASKTTKKYERARTPLARLLDSPHVADEEKKRLRALAASLNPIHLKRSIQQKVQVISAAASVTHLLMQRS